MNGTRMQTPFNRTYYRSGRLIKFLSILSVLFFLPNYLAGITFKVMYLPQGHVIDAISGYGYNPSALATPTTLGCSNPAALVDLQRGLGLSYQYDTKIAPAWLDIIGYQRKIDPIPQSVGLSVPIKNLHLGLAMNQIYTAETLYDNLTATLITQNAQGYIDTVGITTFEKNENTILYSLITTYDFNQLFHSNQSIYFGFQVNYYKYSLYENINTHYYADSLDDLNSGINKKIDAFNLTVGIRYSINNNFFKRINIGTYYETPVRLKKAFNDEDFNCILLAEIPDKIHGGMYFETPCGLLFSGNLSYLFWKNTVYSVKNQPELAVNTGFPVRRNLIISGGAFYTDYRRTDFTDKENDKFRAIYLMLGGIYHFRDFTLELTCADSHLFSGEYRQQTIFKTGIGYTF